MAPGAPTTGGPDGAEGFRQARRRLPHWEQDGATYFVTFRTESHTLSICERNKVLDACRHFDRQRYLLLAAVVMPDHVHLLIHPLERCPGEWWHLSSILHSIKSFSAKQIGGRLGRLWQPESYDRLVRDDGELLEKLLYIRGNPVKQGLCATPEGWDALYEATVSGLP